MTNGKKLLRSSLLALSLLVVGIPAAFAQPVPDNQPLETPTEPAAPDEPLTPRNQATTDEGFDWGWLGLLGLIGLVGLAGRNRAEIPPPPARDRPRP